MTFKNRKGPCDGCGKSIDWESQFCFQCERAQEQEIEDAEREEEEELLEDKILRLEVIKQWKEKRGLK